MTIKKSATKTFQKLTEAYGDETLSRAHVFERYKRFSGERVSVEDNGPAGFPRTFDDGPRNFEPWSSNEDDTWACSPCPNYHTTPMGGHLSSRQI
ncbi:hypothetical protein TNCV_4791251 [Trichonephila clavipes]|nr:hypothetical protein TNCV_4791251 [Trichonephila clavipes]